VTNGKNVEGKDELDFDTGFWIITCTWTSGMWTFTKLVYLQNQWNNFL